MKILPEDYLASVRVLHETISGLVEMIYDAVSTRDFLDVSVFICLCK